MEPDSVDPTSCHLGPARLLSQTFGRELGVGACGAGLFCEAFDGRTVPVCYAKMSRISGEERTDGSYCGSGTCNEELCAGGPGGACAVEGGCANLGTSDYTCPADALLCTPIAELLDGPCSRNAPLRIGRV